MSSAVQVQLVRMLMAERDRQDRLHGPNSVVHKFEESGFRVLAEEVGEAARAFLDGDDAHALEELVQCAAVCRDLVVRDSDYQGRFGGYGSFMGERTGPECAVAIMELPLEETT